MDRRGARAVSSTVGTVMMVAVVVVVAGVASAYALGIADDLREPAPGVAQTSGELVPDVDGGGDQIVRIFHEGGEPVETANLEIVVDATDACGERTRLLHPTVENIDAPDYTGDDILDDGGLKGELGTGSSERWTAGEKIQFRITNGGCSLDPGDTIRVLVIHTPSNAIIFEDTLTAS